MILVLGATGFLGRRLCKLLDDNKDEYAKSSLSLGIDLRDKDAVYKLFESIRPDYVLNCASYVGGIQFGLKHQGELFYNNALMIVNLLEACRQFAVKRLVNPISNCAYPGSATFFKESEFWNGPLHDSVLTYGMMRKMSYIGSLAYYRQYGLDVVNIILSNMYGPEDHFEEERSHALGALIMKMVDAKRRKLPDVTIWGTGKPVREWLHVDDGAKAMRLAMQIAPYAGPINVGIGKGISIKELAYLIKDITGYEGNLVFDTSKIDGAPYKTVDGSLGEKLLGWSPEIDLKKGISDTVTWYLNHRERDR